MRSQLKLRPLNLSDTISLFQLTEKNRQHLREWLPWVDNLNQVSQTEAFIRTSLKLINEGHELHFVITHTQQVIGIISVTEITQQSGIIGYWLDEEWQNQGIMTWACQQVISLCQTTKRMDSLLIRCSPDNLKSQSVALKCEFIFQTILFNAELRHGEYHDLAVYQYCLIEESPS